MAPFSGRKGPRSKEARKLELMRKAATATSPYNIGGNKKTGHYAPRPITLPKLTKD